MSAVTDRFRKNFGLLCERAGVRAEQVVRVTARNMLASMIEKSPVGNPDLWQHPAPKGYVGGRFKNNWNLDLGAVDYRDNFPVDDTGNGAMSRGKAKLTQWKPGDTIYITNSLPYAYRIEYEGWSSQAPRGVVRLTVREFANAMRKAVQETKK